MDTGATISLINKKVKKEIEREIRELNDNNDKNREIFPRIKTRDVDLISIFGTKGKAESHTILVEAIIKGQNNEQKQIAHDFIVVSYINDDILGTDLLSKINIKYENSKIILEMPKITEQIEANVEKTYMRQTNGQIRDSDRTKIKQCTENEQKEWEKIGKTSNRLMREL